MVSKYERRKQILLVIACSIILIFLNTIDSRAADYVVNGWTPANFQSLLGYSSETSSRYITTTRSIRLVNAYDTKFIVRILEDGTGNNYYYTTGSGGYIPAGTFIKTGAGEIHQIESSTLTISRTSNADQTLYMACDTRGVTPYLRVESFASRPGYTLANCVVTATQPHGSVSSNGSTVGSGDVSTAITASPDSSLFDIYIGATSVVAEVTFIWNNNTYTVNYHANGGSGSTASTYHTYDVGANLSGNGFSRYGYDFVGWNTSPDGTGTPFGAGQYVANLTTAPNGVVNLYAQWAPATMSKNIYIRNQNADGTWGEYWHWITSSGAYGSGYDHWGYGTAAGPDNAVYHPVHASGTYTDNNPIYLDAYRQSYTQTNNFYYYQPTQKKWIKFASRSSSQLHGSTYVSTTSGMSASPPTGYHWSHFTTNSWIVTGHKDDADGNGHYYANNYYVRYNGNRPTSSTHGVNASNKVSGSMNNSSHTYDLVGTLSGNGFSLKGWTFAGWSKSSNGSVLSSAQVNNWTATNGGIVDVYAKWTQNNYKVAYKGSKPSAATSNVKGSTNTTSHKYDSVSSLAQNGFSLTGWTFTNWVNSNGTVVSSANNLTATANDTVNLYAQWRQNTYTINYSGNDTTKNIYGDTVTTKFTGTTASTTGCKYDSDVTLAKNGFSKTGYTFKGWNTKSDGTGAMYSSGQTLTKPNFTATDGGSVTLYAIWEPITYTIKFHSNDDSLGNWNTTDSYTQTNVRFDQPTKLIANQFTRTAPFTLSDNTQLSEGYQFIGWSTKEDDLSTLISDKATVTSLTSSSTVAFDLYANWQKDITLAFNPNTGTYKDASTETKQPITLSASIYNSQYTYTFNIDDGTTPAKNNYYTVQTGKIKAYGTSTGTKKASTLVNGENSILTKFDSNGTNYRFLGWNFSPSQTVPNNQFDVFADGSIKSNKNTRTSNYPIYDDTTLYAIWEPILTVSIDLDRVLGSLNANETNSLESIKTSDGKQSIDLTIKAGEQAQYQIATTGHSSKQLQVVFDSRITDIYTHGDNSSPWKDTLNILADLNKTIKPLDRNYTTKFFIPMYLGTTSSYDTSNPTIAKDTDDYTTVFKVYQDSYYYETYKDIKEQVQVTANIHLRNTNTSDDGIEDEESIDSVIEKLKARLKIKLSI